MNINKFTWLWKIYCLLQISTTFAGTTIYGAFSKIINQESGSTYFCFLKHSQQNKTAVFKIVFIHMKFGGSVMSHVDRNVMIEKVSMCVQ